MIDRQFHKLFRGKKVLVTGHTGFKGSWLSIWLHELGAKVVGFALLPATQPNNFEATQLDKKIKSIIGDIRDFGRITDVVHRHKPEIIFHLAAQSLVSEGYEHPRLTYETNIMGLVNLLEAARSTKSVRALLVVTSDKCYENKEWVWGYREFDELGGHDPYSSSKACAEMVTSAYRRSFFSNGKNKVLIASTRAGNVIGGGDWAKNRILPDCVRALVSKKRLKLRNPRAIRPWQHVLEPLSGYLWLASRLLKHGEKFTGPWNFGPQNGHGLNVENLVKRFVVTWDSKNGYKRVNSGNGFHETHCLQLDCSKAVHQLKWRPILDVEEATDWTADWYKRFYENREQAYNLCLENIMAYADRAKECHMKWVK